MADRSGDHERPGVTKKNGPEMARSGKSTGAFKSKSDARYWQGPGKLVFHDSADYSARMQQAGRRHWFPLGTANKKNAAAKAAEIYSFIRTEGLDAAVKRYKPKAEDAPRGAVTVGEFIAAASRLSTARAQSLDAYVKALRLIAVEVNGVGDAGKHSSANGKDVERRAVIEALALGTLTPATVTAWKNKRLREADSDPLVKRRAIVTVNSLLRNGKALFAKKILPFIEQELPLPRPLPFEGVTLEKPPSQRYHSKVDAFQILALANKQLAVADPEAFKVIALALVCGLRRSEIDNLLWRSVDFSRKLIRLQSTEYHQLKSEDSAGEIDLSPDILAMLQKYRAEAPEAVFVVESPNPPKKNPADRHYRADPVFERALAWLRANGVDDRKPIHVLRKEIGSVIASEHGIFEASRYLRHSDIRITAAIYADKKRVITPSVFAGALPAAEKVEG